MNAYQLLDLPATASKAEIRKAYRALARRWHPDRFAEGPERDWANEKMAAINAAYQTCLKSSPAKTCSEDEKLALTQIQELITLGNYLSARQMLMRITTRCAEWNYLFGAVLWKMRETQKALIYLSVAAHQRPDVNKYTQAFDEARGTSSNVRDRLSSLLHRIAR